MNKNEQLDFLIRYLLNEDKKHADMEIPAALSDKRRLFRSLMNVRPPAPVSEDFLNIQDAYLSVRLRERGIVKLTDLTPVQPDLYLWQGDMTTLAVDAIVNAANSRMLGCFVPCHGCIDNAIHTYAGIQLRMACARLMDGQAKEEPTGSAKITEAYNLPCRYVLHTVGPIIYGAVTETNEQQLASCYRSCMELAAKYGLRSVAFCCISTGAFHFPNALAAEIATRTVREWQLQNTDKIKVIFNVFKDSDYEIYRRLI